MREENRSAEKTGGSSPVRAALLGVLAVAAAAAVFGCVVLSRVPPALTDEAARAFLPEGTELLDRHTRDGGRTCQIEYRYTEAFAWCAVQRTERGVFRYEDGSWVPDGEPETLDESEDWTGLAGCWTEQTEGPEGRSLRVQVTGFDGGVLTGQVQYRDGASSWEGPAAEAFEPGQRGGAGRPWILKGSGFFRYNYLRIDRDGGLFFDNDCVPMIRPAPAETDP